MLEIAPQGNILLSAETLFPNKMIYIQSCELDNIKNGLKSFVEASSHILQDSGKVNKTPWGPNRKKT